MSASMRVLAAALVATATAATAQQFTLAQNYSGSTFFDGWTFQNGIDANTTGNVLFQTREQAATEQLAFVNSAGHAIIKVDNTTSGANDPNFGRPSIKILSNATVPAGSIVIMDAVHMPFGCSVWPAFWMQGPNWPNTGEIDVVENVNLEANNRYTLHTLDGCTHPAATDNTTAPEIGTVISTDCFNATNGDEGCIVQDPSTNSFGAGFAQNGGGAYAMLWDDTGIKIWFFPRPSIPSDVSTANPNPSGWGTPTAFWPQSTCNTAEFFSPQTLIFDITICGNFAGAADVFNPSCPGLCTDLVQDPTNYNTAYFEISYVHVFTNGSSTGSTTETGSPPASQTGGSGSGSSSSGASRLGSLLQTFGSSLFAAVTLAAVMMFL